MTDEIRISQQTGPIRLTIISPARVKLRAATAPTIVRIGGMPGPQGGEGPPGRQGPPGNLEEGITLDGGNF